MTQSAGPANRRLVASFFTREQEFQGLQAADVRAAAERRRFEVEVLDAGDNPVLQIQQLFRVIHAAPEERPLALIVQTRVPDGLERVARNAIAAGIGWVLLNRTAGYLDALRAEHPGLIVTCVTTDHEEIGRIQARQFRALLPRAGSVLYVQGPADTAGTQARMKGMAGEIAGAGIDIKAVAAEWTEASAERAVSTWLQLKTSKLFRPDLVGCQNDSLALGARKALLAYRPEWAQIPFTGCDGLPESGQRLVKAGELAATIVVDSCAGPAVELLDGSLKSGQPPPSTLVIPPRSFPPVEELGA
ncbi:MAG: substrate-binding domain-containing protein [Solirubrobacterales bacterium]